MVDRNGGVYATSGTPARWRADDPYRGAFECSRTTSLAGLRVPVDDDHGLNEPATRERRRDC
jgi:hypothetical protein